MHAQDKGVMRERLAELGVPCPRNAIVALGRGRRGVRLPVRAQDDARRVRRQGRVVRPLGRATAPTPFAAAEASGVRLLAEELVDFRRELSALVARSPSGQAASYPVVASTQKDGICHEVVAPAPDLDPELAGQAQEIALRDRRRARRHRRAGRRALRDQRRPGARQRARDAPAQHRPLDPGRRGDLAVREPPARRARPAARLAGAARAVDGDGQHPRRPRRHRSAACTTATRTRWRATRTCGCTSTARTSARGARSGTSTPTATTSTSASSGPGTRPRGSGATWETRVSDRWLSLSPHVSAS